MSRCVLSRVKQVAESSASIAGFLEWREGRAAELEVGVLLKLKQQALREEMIACDASRNGGTAMGNFEMVLPGRSSVT
jgi:hypothetical protein